MMTERRILKENEGGMMNELPRKEELTKKTKLDLFKPMLINLSNQGFRSQQELLEEEDEIEMCFMDEILVELYKEEEEEEGVWIRNDKMRNTLPKPRFVNLAARRYRRAPEIQNEEEEMEILPKLEEAEEEVDGLPKSRLVNRREWPPLKNNLKECPPLKKKARRGLHFPRLSVCRRKLDMELEEKEGTAAMERDTNKLEDDEEFDQMEMLLENMFSCCKK